MEVAAHHVTSVADQVKDTSPLRRAIWAGALEVFHGSHRVGTLSRHGSWGIRLVTLECTKLIVEMVVSAVGSIFQIWYGVLDRIEVQFSMPISLASLRV